MNKTIPSIGYASLADRLGKLNAQIAPLKDEVDAIKQTLRDTGFEIVEGKLYRCSIGQTVDKEYVDWEAVARSGIKNQAKLDLLRNAFTTVKPAQGQVRCSAKVR